MNTALRAPRVGIDVERVQRRGARAWRVTWRVTSSLPLTVIEAWHPHRRFRSSRLRRSLRVPAGRSASLEMPARVDIAPGAVVENCFLVLRATSRRRPWRILARFTLRARPDGTPRPRVEAVDVHPAEG